MPITIALLVVLGFLILSYRQTIKAYPSAGGAYIVTRDNFGLLPAQVAGVALLTDYVLTVAVSVAAGSDALASAFRRWRHTNIGSPSDSSCSSRTATSAARGSRAGCSLPPRTSSSSTWGCCSASACTGCSSADLPKGADRCTGDDPRSAAHHGTGFLMGASVFVVLKAFGSGGAAVTGVEAISNGVPAFRPPAWKNARTRSSSWDRCSE